MFLSALQTARDTGLSFDFALGSNQGQGVPAEPLTEGLAVQLVYGEVRMMGGEGFEGMVPEPNTGYNFDMADIKDFMHRHEEWGPSKLVAVVAGGVKNGM